MEVFHEQRSSKFRSRVICLARSIITIYRKQQRKRKRKWVERDRENIKLNAIERFDDNNREIVTAVDSRRRKFVDLFDLHSPYS